MKDFLRKAKAVTAGHAVGDALGVPVESRSREYLEKNPVTDMTGFGVYPVPKGSWSDDTSMSLCALASIAEQSGKVGVMQNFERWLYNGEFTPTGVTFDAGRTCEAAIRAFIGGESVYGCGQNGEYSNGNGSLMRIHPFTLYAFKIFNKMTLNHFEFISEASALTHAHPRSRAACVLYSFILWELLENPCKQSVAAGLNNADRVYAHYSGGWGTHIDEYNELPKFQRLFDGIQTLDRNSIQSSAYVVDTLEAAIWCLLTTDSYKECVLKAVNLGRDTDTTAAVAGGLAGALYGYDAIPEEWRNTLLRREYIEQLCEKAFNIK